MTTVKCDMWEGLEDEVQADAKLKTIVQDLLVNPDNQIGYQLKKGRLYKDDRIVIPKQSPRIQWLLTELHDSAVGGHSGFFRTYKRVSSLVFWEGMRKNIQDYVQACETC